MTTEQSMLQAIARLEEGQKSLFKRVEKNENLISQIHEISANLKTLGEQLKKYVESSELRGKEQGRRLGDLEKVVLQIQHNEKEIADLSDKLDELRMEPGKNWKSMTFEIVKWVVMGLLALAAASNFFYIGMYY